MRNLMEVLSVGMGKFPASFGPYLVDQAAVIRGQKGTWELLQHIIPVLIYSEIPVDKLLWSESLVPGDPIEIPAGKEGACRFTTIGTLQAIGAAEFLVMQILHLKIKVFGRLLFQPGEKFLIFLMLIFGSLWEPLYLFLHRWQR